MKIAIVRLNWNRSVSANVVEQRLVLNGGDVIVLGPNVEQFDGVEVPQDTSLHAELKAFNGVFESDAAVLDFPVESPQAPSGLTATVVDVRDDGN